MDRRDPYIGDGSPAPIREDSIRRESPRGGVLGWLLGLAIVGAIAGAAWYFLWRDRAPPPPPPASIVVPAAPAPAVAQAPKHPIEAPPEQPLPALKESDGPVSAALASIVGLDTFGKVFLSENLVRNIVATVDNLPRERVSQRVNPIQPLASPPATNGKGASMTLAPANAQRYAAQMRLMES